MPDNLATAEPPRYAGFWRRTLAWLIDNLILGSLVFGSSLVIGPGGAGVVALVASLLYYAILEASSLQGTLGKRLLRMKVVDLDGNRLRFGRALGRSAAHVVSAASFLFGFLVAGFTPHTQTVHDLLTGTVVIHR